MLQKMILQYGARKVWGTFLLLGILLLVGTSFGVTKLRAWYYEGKSERLEAKLETSKLETKVARKDEAQVTRSSEIAAETITAQDTHAAGHRTATIQATEVIDERIRQDPVAFALPDDPVVRGTVAEAIDRAKAAQNRVRGTPPD